MRPRREFGGAILACVLGAGLVLLGLHQHWGRVYYKAPAPLPSGSLPVSGQSLLPSASALALAALACLAAVIATRGLARQAAGLIMAALGAWATVVLGGSIGSASVLAAATGQSGPGGLAGAVPGGNSAISGNSSGGSLPLIGTVSNVVWDGQAWRQAAMAGAVIVIMMGLVTIWRGQRWPVMSARFDRAGQQRDAPQRDAAEPAADAASRLPPPQAVGRVSGQSSTVGRLSGRSSTAGRVSGQSSTVGRVSGRSSTVGRVSGQGSEAASDHAAAVTPSGRPESDAAALWEALDRGEDLTESTAAPREEP